MEQRVTEASLTLTAMLDEFQMSLADVSTLRVGHMLPLSDGGQGRVRIECGERGVSVCSLGERSGRYALRGRRHHRQADRGRLSRRLGLENQNVCSQ